MKNSADKSFLRLEAIIPLIVIIGLISAFFIFFFDGSLRRGIEWATTQVNEAEVDVGSLKTSFTDGSLVISKIEVTDPKEPTRNSIEFGLIQFKFSWDALLRGKFVVDVASVKGVEVGTLRKHPGKLVPPKKEKEEEKPSFVKKWSDQVSGKAMSQVGEMLGGMDPTKNLKVDPAQLKSAAKIKELKAELSSKDQQWNQALTKMPSQQDLSALQNKIAGIKAGGGNPAEIQAKITQVTDVLKESESKVNAVKTQGEALSSDIGGFAGSLKKVDDLVKEDRAELEKTLKLPSVDAKSIGMQLFGGTMLSRLGQAQKWVKEARAYMPAKSAKKEAAPKVKRDKGRNFEFPTNRSYPLFWLKQMEIDGSGPDGQKISGQLTDVTTHPSLIMRPAVLKVSGDIPKQSIRNLKLFVTMDHTGETPADLLKAEVGEFPVGKQTFSDSESLKFGFEKAKGGTELEASLRGEHVEILNKTQLKQADYFVHSQTKLLESTIQKAVQDAGAVFVAAKASGTWDDLNLSVESNLAGALQRAFEAQLKAKLDEAKKKIDELIQQNIAQQKAELTKQFEEKKAKALAAVDERKKQAESVQKMAASKLNEVKNQASNVQKKAVDILKKKLPF